jgi:hypothetical protein
MTRRGPCEAPDREVFADNTVGPVLAGVAVMRLALVNVIFLLLLASACGNGALADPDGGAGPRTSTCTGAFDDPDAAYVEAPPPADLAWDGGPPCPQGQQRDTDYACGPGNYVNCKLEGDQQCHTLCRCDDDCPSDQPSCTGHGSLCRGSDSCGGFRMCVAK